MGEECLGLRDRGTDEGCLVWNIRSVRGAWLQRERGMQDYPRILVDVPECLL